MARRGKYDWDEWLSAPRTVLYRGVHYSLSQAMMYQTIKNNAHQRGVRVKVHDGGTYTVIEVIHASSSNREAAAPVPS